MTSSGANKAPLTLRPAREDDFDHLLALKSEGSNVYWSGFAEAPDRDAFQEWFRNLPQSRTVYLAALAGEVAGYLYLDAPDGSGQPLEVTIGVGENFRGRGVATRMLTAILAELAARGETRDVVAWIYLDNGASIRAFERAGFVQDDTAEPRLLVRQDVDGGAPQGLWRFRSKGAYVET